MPRRSRFGLAALIALAVALLAAAIALAQGGAADKIRSGDSVKVPAGETIAHNLYAFGRSVTIDGTIDGDLVAAAEVIIINGTVTGDVIGAASTIDLYGTVAGDARVAGGYLVVSGPVGGDLAAASSSILVSATGKVGKDFLFYGNDVSVDGTVSGGIAGNANRYARRGSVEGAESVTLPQPPDQPASDATAAKAIDAVRQFVVVLLVGLLGLRLAPRLTRASAMTVRGRPLAALVGGVLALAGYLVAVISIVIAMILVAIAFTPLGFDGLVAFAITGGLLAALGLSLSVLFFCAFVGDAIVGLALGRLAANTERSRSTELLWLAVGSGIVVLVTSFPVVGAIFKLVVILLALGGFVIAVNERRRRAAQTPPFAPQAPAGSGWG